MSCNGWFQWVPRTVDLDCDWHEFERNGQMKLAKTSGSKFLYAPNGVGSEWSLGSNDWATCEVNVPTAGVYEIEGDVSAPSGTDDSFFVQIDGAPNDGWTWGTQRSGGFVLDRVNSDNGGADVQVNLAAGAHTIKIYKREDGTMLHSIALINVGAPLGSDIVVDAKGTSGGEQMSLEINGTVVETWTVSTSWTDYQHTHSSTVDIYDIRVSFDSGGNSSRNLRISSVTVDGVQSDTVNNAELFTTGAETANYCTNNEYYSLTDRLACNGWFEWVPRTPSLVCDWHEFILTGDMELGIDGSTKFFEVPSGNNMGGAGNPNSATCVLNIPVSGTYQVNGLLKATSGGNNSFWVTFDGDTSSNDWLWDTAQDPINFINDLAMDRDGSNPESVFLTAGTHTITIWNREDGTKLHSLEMIFVS